MSIQIYIMNTLMINDALVYLMKQVEKNNDYTKTIYRERRRCIFALFYCSNKRRRFKFLYMLMFLIFL